MFARLLDSISLPLALLIGLGIGFSPFLPEPHIVEKLRMVFDGSLTRPLDIFDLFYHFAALALLAAKLVRVWVQHRA